LLLAGITILANSLENLPSPSSTRLLENIDLTPFWTLLLVWLLYPQKDYEFEFASDTFLLFKATLLLAVA
jgi:hypothetical protein